jgi:hypothetical protein
LLHDELSADSLGIFVSTPLPVSGGGNSTFLERQLVDVGSDSVGLAFD